MSWNDTVSTVVELLSALHLLKCASCCCLLSVPLLILCIASLLCCSSSARLGHNRMLYLNTRVYSLYWDISLLCLSRASVEQLTARSLRARTVHIYRFDFPPQRSTSDAKRSCPFPSSAIKTAVSSTSHLLFQHRFAIFVPRVRAHLVQLRRTPPNALRASHAPSSRASPHDALLTFLIADRTPPPLPPWHAPWPRARIRGAPGGRGERASAQLWAAVRAIFFLATMA